MRDSTPTAWTSWHLHLATPSVTALDRVVTKVVTPVVGGLDGPWFFIRYWQGGPHVRLRIADLDPGERAVVRARLNALLARHGAPLPGEPVLDPAQYAEDAGRHARSESGDNRVVSGLSAPGVHSQAYEPELDRYGGAAAMGASERLFHHSSRLAAQMLPALDLPRRRAAAMRLAAASAAPLGDATAKAVFFAIGRDSWSMWARSYGFPDEVIERTRTATALAATVAEPGRDPGWVTGWRHAVAGLVQTLDSLGHLVPGAVVSSHVHMMHNRLGLTTLDELRTYAVLAQAHPAPEGAVPDFATLAG